MKQALCKEFCDQLSFRQVPAGYAVGTNYVGLTGDAIGFYIVKAGLSPIEKYRIEDDGATIPILEACGADLGVESRATAFQDLLDQYQIEYDEDRGELKTPAMSESEIPKAALRFVAFMLRVQDVLLLTRERAESTFRQEAIRELQSAIGDRADIQIDEAVSNEIDIIADVVIRAPQQPPVALFLVTQDAKLYEAMLLQTDATLKANVAVKVIALMERENSVSRKTFSQAMNRLIPLRYRGDEKAAMSRIEREVFGAPQYRH